MSALPSLSHACEGGVLGSPEAPCPIAAGIKGAVDDEDPPITDAGLQQVPEEAQSTQACTGDDQIGTTHAYLPVLSRRR